MVSITTQYTLTSSITTGGEYQCTVTNGAGNDTDNATVNGEHWTLMYCIFIGVVIMSFFLLNHLTFIIVEICINY